MGETGVGFVEVKRKNGGQRGGGGRSSSNCQRYVQAIVVTPPFTKLPLSERLKRTSIRRGVIYYAGNFLPQVIFVEFIMRGNSVSHYVDRLFRG